MAIDMSGFAPSPILQQAMSTPAKPKMFSKDGAGWKILGIIGDALQAANGGQGTYMPAMMDLQERTAKERERQQQLAAQAQALQGLGMNGSQIGAIQTGAAKYGDFAQNPSEDSFTRAMAAAGIQPGSPEYIALARKRAEMLTNPVQLVPDGMGGATPVRPNSLGGGLPQGYDPNEWEVVGGGPQASPAGGFPRPY